MQNQNFYDPGDAVRCYLENLVPNIAMVFVFNIHRKKRPKTMIEILSQRELQTEKAIKFMETFFNVLQAETFGSRWHKHTRREWPTAWGFCEHPTTNLHYHVVVDACPRFTRAIYERGAELWKSIVPAGSIYFDLPEDLRDTVQYWTKELRRPGRLEAMFVYGHKKPKKRKAKRK